MPDIDTLLNSFVRTNSLETLSGKEFDVRLEAYIHTNSISPEDLASWAEDFDTFLCENRTFDPGLEMRRILSKYLT